MKGHIVIGFVAQTSNLAKFLFCCSPECSHPVRVEDFLNCNISRKSRVNVLILYMQLNIQRAKNWS